MSFGRWLEARPGDDAATLVLAPRAEHEVAPGVVHFAVLATLGEVAAAQAVGVAVVPAQVSVQLLRPASSAESLVARGRLLKAGRSLVFAEGEVTQGERLVAKVTVTFARRA